MSTDTEVKGAFVVLWPGKEQHTHVLSEVKYVNRRAEFQWSLCNRRASRSSSCFLMRNFSSQKSKTDHETTEEPNTSKSEEDESSTVLTTRHIREEQQNSFNDHDIF